MWLLALRKDYLPEVKDRVDHLLKDDRVITTGIVKLEIPGGTRTAKEFQRLKSRMDVLYAVETDTSLWEDAYKLAFNLRWKGVAVPYTDVLVAASAIKANAVLVHADAHYDLTAKHTKLNVESFVRIVRGCSKKKK